MWNAWEKGLFLGKCGGEKHREGWDGEKHVELFVRRKATALVLGYGLLLALSKLLYHPPFVYFPGAEEGLF